VATGVVWLFSSANAPNPCYHSAMERDDAIARPRAHEVELRQFGVERLYLFGSTARAEATEDADVDPFFDCESS
jgi:predicted nucleotidyltransferase